MSYASAACSSFSYPPRYICLFTPFPIHMCASHLQPTELNGHVIQSHFIPCWVARRKLRTPGTAKEHKRQGTPTITFCAVSCNFQAVAEMRGMDTRHSSSLAGTRHVNGMTWHLIWTPCSDMRDSRGTPPTASVPCHPAILRCVPGRGERFLSRAGFGLLRAALVLRAFSGTAFRDLAIVGSLRGDTNWLPSSSCTDHYVCAT